MYCRPLKIVSCVAVACAAVLPAPVSAFPALIPGPNACHIGAPDLQAIDVCYSPKQVDVAERRMPVTPINPGQVVWHYSHLQLHQVMLRMSNRPFDIEYLYGRMPVGGSYATPDPAKASPKYVLVSEMTYLANASASRATHISGYWFYWRNLRCRPLALFVSTNISARVATAVIDSVDAPIQCGK